MEKLLTSRDAFLEEAATCAAKLSPQEGRATLVTLSGDLGAGKTTFVQAVARELGVTESVTSPTFVLEKVYPLPGKEFEELVHIDTYRLGSGRELHALDFETLMQNPRALIFLEWPEMVVDGLPEPDLRISIEALPDESRRITYA